MSCSLFRGNYSRWIKVLNSPKKGYRNYATKSHMRRMTKKNFEILVKSDKVVIFSKSNCLHSQAAKNLFNDIHTKFTAVELDRREDGFLMQTHMGIVTGSANVPKIFIVGKCIGGYCDLVELHQNGILVKLLKQDP